jgi:hypothetical protein
VALCDCNLRGHTISLQLGCKNPHDEGKSASGGSSMVMYVLEVVDNWKCWSYALDLAKLYLEG